MIVLCTDYSSLLYTGQVHARITALDNSVPVIDGIDDLPAFNIWASAFLLGALVNQYPDSAVIIGVVDPGVGGQRAAICFRSGSKWYVGPDNGIFACILSSASEKPQIYRISEHQENISRTFHGRDVFAPAAVKLVRGEPLPMTPIKDSVTEKYASIWPEQLREIIYIDRFGNCITGMSGDSIDSSNSIRIGDNLLSQANTFCEVETGDGFWYVNSLGLVEISINQASAAKTCELAIGDKIEIC